MRVGKHMVDDCRFAFAYSAVCRVAFASVGEALHMPVWAERVAFAYADEHRVAFASSAVNHMVSYSPPEVFCLENWTYSASFADNVLGFVKTERVLPVL